MIEPLLKTSRPLVVAVVLFAVSTAAYAQMSEEVLPFSGLDAAPSGLLATPAANPEPVFDKEQQKGTVVTATETASFDNTSRAATFVGAVKVVDPQFKLSCDKLTVVLADTKAKTEENEKSADKTQNSSLERILAEGNVVVVQTRKNQAGEITEYIGKGERGQYDAKSGDFTLSGWPEVQQGINKHVATEAGTVMVISRDGTMKTLGGSKTMIQETPSER